MHVMCGKKKCNAMHVNPKHNWCMKILVKNLKTENFPVSIDRASIDTNRVRPRAMIKIKGFLIDRKSHSIDRNSRNLNFLKNCRRLCKNYSNQGISWMKCLRMSLNVFLKHEFSTHNFKTRFLIIKNIIFANP